MHSCGTSASPPAQSPADVLTVDLAQHMYVNQNVGCCLLGNLLHLLLVRADDGILGQIHQLVPLAVLPLPINALVYTLDGVLVGASDFG